VLLDRDGVINRQRRDHVKSWAEFEFLPGALDALRKLHGLGVQAVLITNQSAVGRGLLSDGALEAIHVRMTEAIHRAGGSLAGIYVCPHRPDQGCACRKPSVGLIIQAWSELGFDMATCIMVGDSESDLTAARIAGCRAILVAEGSDVHWRRDVLVVPDLRQAVGQVDWQAIEVAV
jgi:D-glycero-D-manno-heptose 1,7-bisphosphate phosphatase